MRLAAFVLLGVETSSALQPKKHHHHFARKPSPTIEAPINNSVSATNFQDDGPEPIHCIRSWLIYDSATKAAIELQPTSTWSPSGLSSVEITLGTANVFATIDSVPVALGSFTPTATSTTRIWKTVPTTFYERITVGSWPTTPPNCSRENSSERSKICEAYLTSRGLCRDGTTIKPPSVWFDSFACPLPSTTCVTYSTAASGCFIGGQDARLFYFPELVIRTGPDASLSFPTVFYSFEPGITFTSPSRYIFYDHLTAVSQGDLSSTVCSFCDYGNCVTTTIGIERNTEMVGTTEFGPIVEIPTTMLNPTAQSTTAPSSPFDHSSNGFTSISTPPPLQITDLADMDFWLPASSAYYVNQREAPGCDVFQDQKFDIPGIECNTIFRDLYRPEIVIASEVTEVQDAWTSCLITAGVTATPVALTEVTVSLVLSLSGYEIEGAPVAPTVLKPVKKAAGVSWAKPA